MYKKYSLFALLMTLTVNSLAYEVSSIIVPVEDLLKMQERLDTGAAGWQNEDGTIFDCRGTSCMISCGPRPNLGLEEIFKFDRLSPCWIGIRRVHIEDYLDTAMAAKENRRAQKSSIGFTFCHSHLCVIRY